jgi:hypothetical protein
MKPVAHKGRNRLVIALPHTEARNNNLDGNRSVSGIRRRTASENPT